MKNTILDIIKETKLEEVYSIVYGIYLYVDIDETKIYPIKLCSGESVDLQYTADGQLYNSGECLIFPNKESRDWNEWYKNWKIERTLKTWDELHNIKGCKVLLMDTEQKKDELIYKSAIAYIKILQLIDNCYGGIISKKDWNNTSITKYCIDVHSYANMEIIEYKALKNTIAFYSYAQAIEFLSYPKNVQLIKDYYMLSD